MNLDSLTLLESLNADEPDDLISLEAHLAACFLPVLERLLDGRGHAAAPYLQLAHVSHF